ncbi:hypothetical protein N9Y79_03300 [Alphaproteobacteria bacterium]|nr:hypothetical protein [Alphaproteobacteria bacterium]MDB2641550.1 hypothetical protein [Alphaproteobacteria bacterium]
MPKFEEWSPWVARPDPLHAPLTGAHKADIDSFTRRAIPLPPEPLRWLTIKGLTAFYNRRDRKVDADLAKR